MANAKQCDRCKKFYPDEDMSGMPYSVKNMQGADIDLCKECKYDLEEWVDRPVIKGKKKRQSHNWSDEAREAAAERQKARTDIAKLIQASSNDMTWDEALSKAGMRIAKAKEQKVSLEELRQSIERSTKYNEDRGNKKPLCPMCGKNKVDREGEMCQKCHDDWNEYQQNK